jgi:hypothetical protein
MGRFRHLMDSALARMLGSIFNPPQWQCRSNVQDGGHQGEGIRELY